MKQRGISNSEVEETILQPYFTLPSHLDRFIAVKKYGDKYLKAICEKSNDKIIVIKFIGQGDHKYGASRI
jgi:hypothetical protein